MSQESFLKGKSCQTDVVFLHKMSFLWKDEVKHWNIFSINFGSHGCDSQGWSWKAWCEGESWLIQRSEFNVISPDFLMGNEEWMKKHQKFQMSELKSKNAIKFLVGYRIKFQSKFQIISKKKIFVSKWMLGWNRIDKLKSSLCQKTTTFGTMLLLLLT